MTNACKYAKKISKNIITFTGLEIKILYQKWVK